MSARRRLIAARDQSSTLVVSDAVAVDFCALEKAVPAGRRRGRRRLVHFQRCRKPRRKTGVSHFDSDREIDEHVRSLDLPFTILKPVFFFENLEAFAEDIVDHGTLALPLVEGVGLQMVSNDDLGHAATVTFERPDEFVGESIDLAGDEKTLGKTANVLSEVTGVDVEAVHVPIKDVYESFGEKFTVMCKWFNEAGYSADIPELEAQFSFEFDTLDEYLREHG